jgi:hypothetical protein
MVGQLAYSLTPLRISSSASTLTVTKSLTPQTFEDLHGSGRKAALRKAGIALHVKDDRVAGDGGVDALLNVGHDFSRLKIST